VVCYTGGSEAFRVDSNRRLLVGTSSSPTTGQGQYARIVAQGYNGDATGGGIVSIQRGSAATVSGSALGQITFGDNTGATFATINCDADGTVSSASDLPGRLVFSTTADGASSPTERMRIDSSGRVGIGTTSPSRRLTVNSTTTGNINYVRLQETTTNTPTNGGSFIELGGTRSNGTYGFYGGILGGRRFQGGDNTGYLAFYTDNNDGESLAERVRIDHLGRLLVGTSTARGTFYNGTSNFPLAQIEGTSFATSGLSITRSDASASGGGVFLAKQRSGSNGGNALVAG
jgi:hypothetical protein